jgi:hypothetical protein
MNVRILLRTVSIESASGGSNVESLLILFEICN